MDTTLTKHIARLRGLIQDQSTFDQIIDIVESIIADIWSEHVKHQNYQFESLGFLLNTAYDLAMLLDTNGCVIQINDALLQRLNKTRAQVINHPATNLVAPEVAALRERYARRVLETAKPLRFEDQNADRFLETLMMPIFNDSGEVNQLAVYVRDITEQKRHEAAIEAERTLYQLVADQTYDWEYLELKNRRLRYNSPACERITGYPVESITDMNEFIHTIIHSDDHELWDVHYRMCHNEVLRQPGCTLQFRIRHQDGGVRWVEHICHRIYDADGCYIGIRASNRDITDRKRVETLITSSASNVRQMLDSVQQSMMLVDTGGRLIVCNQAAEVAAETYQRCQVQPGMLVRQFVHPYRYDDFEDNFARACRGETIHAYGVFPFKEIDHHYEATYIPIMDDGGTVQTVCIMTDDITERKQAEQNQLALLLEKERVSLLTNFVRDASHEFRTPLAIINTKIYLLRRMIALERSKAHLDEMQSQSDNILKLVTSLVTLTQLESGTTLNISSEPLSTLLTIAHDALSPQIAANAIHVNTHIAADMPDVEVDVEQFLEAVQQVLGNAIRFSECNSWIWINATHDSGVVEITIRDEGIGIAAADHPKVFERFWRGDTAHTTRGLGLGLPIALKVFQAHGGDITFTSTEGQGSTFILVFPARQSTTV